MRRKYTRYHRLNRQLHSFRPVAFPALLPPSMSTICSLSIFFAPLLHGHDFLVHLAFAVWTTTLKYWIPDSPENRWSRNLTLTIASIRTWNSLPDLRLYPVIVHIKMNIFCNIYVVVYTKFDPLQLFYARSLPKKDGNLTIYEA
jgi:hypothetical protein